MNGSLLCPMLPPLRTIPRLPPEITNFIASNTILLSLSIHT